jgi:hypothetical protein
VLTGLLGLSPAEVAALRAEGAVGQPGEPVTAPRAGSA